MITSTFKVHLWFLEIRKKLNGLFKKEHYVVLEKTLFVFMTLKDDTVYTVLLCLHVADPATSLAYLIFLLEQLIYSLKEKVYISEFVLLPH